MQLVNLGGGVGYLKMGFLGFAGSGKTFTAKEAAIGTRAYLKLDGPIAMFDTEGGAQYIAADVKKRTGKDLVGVQSRALADAIEFVRHCEASGISVAIIDSVTHLWRELCETYLKEVNKRLAEKGRNPRTRLEFQDWNEIKKRWEIFTTAYLNSKLHIIISGRAGFEYDFEQREDGSGKDLVKTGIKMKTESEMGYEPSLLVLMERVQIDDSGALQKKITHHATVIKERFGVLDGKECDNPGFDFFKPHIELLTPGAHVSVDTNRVTPIDVNESGDAEFQRERRQRAIFCEEIQGLLVKVYPGMSAPEKTAKMEILFNIFGTRSWTAIEGMDSVRLKAGFDALPAAIEKYRGAVNPTSAAEEIVEHFTREAKPKNGEKAQTAGKAGK